MPSEESADPQVVVKPNPKNNPTMFQIFQNVQYNIVQHKKYVKEMTKLYKKMDPDDFKESFQNALHYLFTFGDTSANVDRVVQFVATFCTTLDDEEEFLLFIFEIIFNSQCVSGQSVRYRASQLLAAVLAALGEDASLDDDLCDKLLASQMQRLQDTRGAVRCRAALALQRLQNPMDPDDEVTRAYRFHMSCDPSSSVRRAVVMSIAKCTRNVSYVLERLCDVDEAVRRAAFLYIAAINVTQLRVRQRVLTLKVGLTERSPRVRRVVEEILIPGWLSTFRGNIVDLLRAIRLDNAHDAKDSQVVAGKLLESLFKRLPVSELLEWLPTDKSLRLIPAEKLNKETAWYWRHLAVHLQKIGDDETLETVLPDLIVLTGYIKAIIEAPCPPENEEPTCHTTRQYVLHELGEMLQVYDAGDQAGRTALQQLVTDVLTGDYGTLSPDVLRSFVSALELVVPEVAHRLEVVSGVISALREPPDCDVIDDVPPSVDCTEAKLQRARLRVSLNVAIEAQEEAVRDQNYALAEECKAKVRDIQKKLEEINIQPPPPPVVVQPTIKEKISDAATINKCLIILNCALDSPQVTKITPMMQMIFNELEVEVFQNPDVLENALETVALYGMLDKNFARENKAFFFANLIDTTNESVVSTVLRCIVDLLCVHGAKVFEDDEATNDSTLKKRHISYDEIDEEGNLSEAAISMSSQHSTVIELLLKIMDSACSAYRLIIVEGLCRLLHLGHLESPAILSRLFILWFNPATVDEEMLRQVIGVFFQSFASTCEGAQEQIQKATIPTLRALANAPSSSPVAEIDQEAVVRFIVSLTRVSHELTDSQGAMAMQLCSHLVRRPNCSEAGLVCRMLALLSPPRDACIASDLAAMLRNICTKMTDKPSCRNLIKYLGALEALERASMNKNSTTMGNTEASLQPEDSLRISRITNSLPPPIGRSTHVVVNETIEEEVEIDETSPSDPPVSKIAEEISTIEKVSKSPEIQTRKSSDSIGNSQASASEEAQSGSGGRGDDSDSSGISPVKKLKKGAKGKKKLSINKKSTKATKAKEVKVDEPATKPDADKVTTVKTSRSQKTKANEDKAKTKSKPVPTTTALPEPDSPKSDLDISNITIRKSNRTLQTRSSSSPDSVGSRRNKKSGEEKAPETPQLDLDSSNVTIRRSSRRPPSTVTSTPDSHSTPVRGAKRGAKTKALETPPLDLDSSNVTIRRSSRRPPSTVTSTPDSHSTPKRGAQKRGIKTKETKNAKGKGKKTQQGRGSSGRSSQDSLFSNSFDDTELHTIVYDQDIAQSLLEDSDNDKSSRTKDNVTIPETPEQSEESDSEPEVQTKKTKAKQTKNK